MADLIGFTQLQFLEVQEHPDRCVASAQITFLHQQLLPLLHLAREGHLLLTGEQIHTTDVLQIQAEQVIAAAPADRGMSRRSWFVGQKNLEG